MHARTYLFKRYKPASYIHILTHTYKYIHTQTPTDQSFPQHLNKRKYTIHTNPYERTCEHATCKYLQMRTTS
jgi:hypothetical protein